MLEISNLLDAKDFLIQKKVVVFDLDDTLYSEKEYVRSGYAQVAKNFKKIDAMQDKLWSAFENKQPAINYVLEQEGLLSDEAVSFCLNIYRNHSPNISLYPEAKELILLLKENGVRLGIITDGRPEGQRAKIEALQIEKYFEKIIITDELGGIEFRKPNMTAFEKMQTYFNVQYKDMVYVGDNIKKDFKAPQLLGMNSVYFKNTDGLYYID